MYHVSSPNLAIREQRHTSTSVRLGLPLEVLSGSLDHYEGWPTSKTPFLEDRGKAVPSTSF